MTEKIFELDVMQKNCESVVTVCTPFKEGYAIELDRTVFYPEGGGQLSDRGRLLADGGEVEVFHVREKEGHILHETREPIEVGTRVTAELDWQYRFDHMQQHCGEHLLSYGFWKLWGADNIGFHMSEDMVTIDLSRELGPEEISQVEALANTHIQEDRPITAVWLEAEEAAGKAARKFNDKLTGLLRVVTIEGSDSCTCCGTHPPRTGMVGLVKIFKAEKHKQGTRIYFLCGRLALERIGRGWESLKEASQELSLKEEEINLGVARLREENRELKEKVVRLEKEWAVNEARELLAGAEEKAGCKEIVVEAGEISFEAARTLAQELVQDPKAQVTVFYTSRDRLNYLLMQGDEVQGSCRERIAALNAQYQGRGGGRDNQAQGSAPLPH